MDLRELNEQLKYDLEKASLEIYDHTQDHRWHLGASIIGDECPFKIWGTFRWLKRSNFSGRMLRLFNRGHREEERFITYLRQVGFIVKEYDFDNNKLLYYDNADDLICVPNSEINPNDLRYVDVSDDEEFIIRALFRNVKIPQYRISDCHGHFGGSCDSICVPPKHHMITDPYVLAEFKTSGKKSFGSLLAAGMAAAKNEHFCQTSTYGYKFGIKLCVYLSANKDDDEIHPEYVPLNWELGQDMIYKASRVIGAMDAPPKLSHKSTFWKCKNCHLNKICHSGAIPEKNCRSCRKCIAVENSQFGCIMYNQVIPNSFVPNGCGEWKPITVKE